LGSIKGLDTVWFSSEKQSGLVQLRNALKESGLRDLEREATYAIEHSKTKNYEEWHRQLPRLLLFEWTCEYGLHSLRPIKIVSVLFVVFSIVYIFPIVGKSKNGINRVWQKRGNKEEEIERLKGAKFIGYAFYFSLLSAFHIGWKDLNVGNWIARIQPNDYFMKATGWVKTVSGIQSLVSIYLFVLWMLTQFGRPFE